MKRILKNFTISLFMGLMVMVCSCSKEQIVWQPEQENYGWHSARLTFEVRCASFDQSGAGTRASGSYAWNDGDVVYLLLTDKDGGKIKGYVRYDGSTHEWGQVQYFGYKSHLTCTTERVAEAYFIEGENNVTHDTISIDDTKAVYACTDGSYVYPTDSNDMIVKVLLKPLTGRIRFRGTVSSTASISGVKTYTKFFCTTGQISESASAVNTTVTDTGYTPYIYCLLMDESNPTLTVTTDKTYRTIFDASSSVLTAGSSGYLDLPTAEKHRGWITIVVVTGVRLDKSSLLLNKDETATLVATVMPEDATEPDLIWASSDTTVAKVDNNGRVTAIKAGTAMVTATSISDASKKATCIVTIFDANGYEYVDLGLTSGTLWATYNVGGTSFEEYGNYFAWGETMQKNSYKDLNYSYSSNPTTLPTDRDAARTNWGGSWSMPTVYDFKELYDECTWTWTTMNGKNGYKVSSKKNSSYIFLAAEGYFGSSPINVGSRGNYWSSSLLTSNTTYAYELNFDSNNVGPSNYNYRYYGRSVRPVIRK